MDEARAELHADMLRGRVRKNFRRLHPGFRRNGVGAFRLYDRDIPEVRAVVDWYAGHLVVGEFERWQTAQAGDWLRVIGVAAAEALGVPLAFLHLKRRRTRPQGAPRYDKDPETHSGPGDLLIHEHGLRFRVNLDSYLDTGLFLDHRTARARVRAAASGRTVLNLFAYTGGFSVAALAGGAKHVTSVDLSRTYLAWAQTNLRENALPLERHEPVRREVFAFLGEARKHHRTWDLVILDPPSFSTRGEMARGDFDVVRDHRALLEATLAVVAKGGTLLFSTNHQRFLPNLEGLPGPPREVTEDTVPIDFRSRHPHRSWLIKCPGGMP